MTPVTSGGSRTPSTRLASSNRRPKPVVTALEASAQQTGTADPIFPS